MFSYIQGISDREDRPGRFILTGSQDFLLLQRVSQSLAGRCAIHHLLPFSRAELSGRRMMDLSRIGYPRRRVMKKNGRAVGVNRLFEMLFTGFYPRIHDKQLPPQGWFVNDYQTYLERDVRDVLNVGDIET